jgi:hypothetical protein
MLKKLAVAALAFLLSVPAFAGGVPQIPATSQYSEPSQIVGTLNALINQLNGNGTGLGGYAALSNNAVSLGSLCQPAAGASPLTCNGQRMIAAFTGLSSLLATGTTQTVVITNSSITAQSACTAQWITAFTAGSAIIAATVTPSAGSLSIVNVNAGSTTNAVATGTLAVNCFN